MSKKNNTIHITIDGKRIETEAGRNLLGVAREAGFDIPGLCFHPKISPTGACRLCLVKLNGRNEFVASCTVKVTDNMVVTAFDADLEAARKELAALLLSEHNRENDGSFENELMELVRRYGLHEEVQTDYPPIWADKGYGRDTTAPVLEYDGTKCIKCFRCTKACDEIQQKNVLSMTNRGIYSYIVGGLGVWGESECDGCGECVQICPTGAIVEKPLIKKVDVKQVEKK